MKENWVKHDENKRKIKKNERELETKNEEGGVKIYWVSDEEKVERRTKANINNDGRWVEGMENEKFLNNTQSATRKKRNKEWRVVNKRWTENGSWVKKSESVALIANKWRILGHQISSLMNYEFGNSSVQVALNIY